MTEKEKIRETFMDKQKWVVQYKSQEIFNDKVQNLPTPHFNFDNHQQIERVFQEFSSNFDKKELQQQLQIRRRGIVGKTRLRDLNQIEIIPQKTKSDQKISLKKNIENPDQILKGEFKYLEQKKLEYQNWLNKTNNKWNANKTKDVNPLKESINPVVNYFGNHLIASVFQALIIQKIKELYNVKINIDSGYPISTQIIKVFGINLIQLQKLPTEKQRLSYIIQTMNSKVDELLQDWSEKTKNREIKQQQIDNENKMNMKTIDHDIDIFQWLDIKNKHDNLRKKLRKIIIEKINDFENQVRVIEQINQKNEKQRVSLVGIQPITTKQIIQKMDQNALNYQNRNSYRQFEIEPSQNKNEPKFEWNENLEQAFIKNKNIAKKTYYDDIARINFSELGYQPIIQKFNLDNKKQLTRDALLDRYMEGECLTQQEYKFIADSSSLLNSCLDKKFLQNVVNNLDSESLNQMELNLAENLIQNYNDMKQMIQRSRLNFIQQKVKNSSKKIDQKTRNWTHEKEIIKGRKNQQFISKLISIKLKKDSKSDDIKIIYHSNFFVKLFVNVVKIWLEKYRIKKQYQDMQQSKQIKSKDQVQKKIEIKKNQQLSIQKLYMESIQQSKDLSSTLKKHQLHPPSKVAFFQKDIHNLEDNNDDIEVQVQRKRKIYMNSLRAKPEVRQKENFSQFLSGGPLPAKQRLYSPLNPNQIPITPKEMQSVVFLQKFFRRYRMRQVINNTKENEYNQKYKQYYKKLLEISKGDKLKKITSKMIKSKNRNQQQQQKFPNNQRILSDTKQITSEINLDQIKSIQIDNTQNQLILKNKQSINSISTPTQKYHTASSLYYTSNRSYQTQTHKESSISLIQQKIKALINSAVNNQIQYFLLNKNNYTSEDLRQKDKQGNTALYYTVKNNDLEFTKSLLENDANPNQRCSDGNTPLHIAFINDNIQIIEILMRYGGDLNIINYDGRTPPGLASLSAKQIFKLHECETYVKRDQDFKSFDNNVIFQFQFDTKDKQQNLKGIKRQATVDINLSNQIDNQN